MPEHIGTINFYKNASDGEGIGPLPEQEAYLAKSLIEVQGRKFKAKTLLLELHSVPEAGIHMPDGASIVTMKDAQGDTAGIVMPERAEGIWAAFFPQALFQVTQNQTTGTSRIPLVLAVGYGSGSDAAVYFCKAPAAKPAAALKRQKGWKERAQEYLAKKIAPPQLPPPAPELYYRLPLQQFLFLYEPVNEGLQQAIPPYRRPQDLLEQACAADDDLTKAQLIGRFGQCFGENPDLCATVENSLLLYRIFQQAISGDNEALEQLAMGVRGRLHEHNPDIVLTVWDSGQPALPAAQQRAISAEGFEI